jgi:parallel beta helix pectate lyase-like protein
MSRADAKHLALLVAGLALVGAGCDEHSDLPVTYEPPATTPSLQDFSASPESVGPGEVLRLGATAKDSRGSLSFAWTTTAGTVSGPVGSGERGEALWVSPSCLPADVTPTVTVTVTNAVGLSASHTFPVSWTGPACTRPACAFALETGRVLLAAECTTDLPLFIPDDFTFDGQGHTVTAVDPPSGHFTGAILRNRGSTARVRNVTVTASGLADLCEAGAARLRGILLEGASGEVVDSAVSGLAKGASTSGCQEGFGIEVRNDDASRGPFRVDVLRNRVSGYQKAGILAVGAVEVTITGNTVEGGGPVAHIARNGIQVSNGARGSVTDNSVSGNAYTGATGDTGAGIVVSGGSYYGAGTPLSTGLVIEGNTLTGNDIGISLSQLEGSGGTAPSTPTRIRVAGNVLSNGAATNPSYQAAIADFGTGNVITSNTVSGPGYDPATAAGRTFSVDVVAVGPASALAFLTPAQDVAAGACSGKVTVQSQDSAGNLVPSAGTFSLEASGPLTSDFTFHADPACTGAPITTVDLSGPQAEATFYFKSSQPGAVTLGVSGGALSPASQGHTVH